MMRQSPASFAWARPPGQTFCGRPSCQSVRKGVLFVGAQVEPPERRHVDGFQVESPAGECQGQAQPDRKKMEGPKTLQGSLVRLTLSLPPGFCLRPDPRSERAHPLRVPSGHGTCALGAGNSWRRRQRSPAAPGGGRAPYSDGMVTPPHPIHLLLGPIWSLSKG